MNLFLRVSFLLLCVPLLPGCAFFGFSDNHLYEKPLIAVVEFENRAHFPLNWRLGEGIAEILEDALYQTGKFRVLDRGDLDHVLAEQKLQATGRTRDEESVPPNRLKNAHYLVKGVITEFAHVSMSGWDFGIGPLRLGAGGEHAIVNIALKVTEVESGEVVYTRVVEGKAYAGEMDFAGVYKHVALGGHQFYQTPLGRALQEALVEAVDGVQARIARRLWCPTIAKVDGQHVFLSGGEDRRIKVGSRWAARQRTKPVVDPLTGDVLGHEPGELVGTVRVMRVDEHYSIAVVEGGAGFERGQRLEPRKMEEEAGGAELRAFSASGTPAILRHADIGLRD